MLDALQEDVDFCEDGETTIALDRAIPVPGVFYITDDGREVTVEEDEVPQILLQARPAFRHPGYRAVREDLGAAQRPRFLQSQTRCRWQRAGISCSIQTRTLKIIILLDITDKFNSLTCYTKITQRALSIFSRRSSLVLVVVPFSWMFSLALAFTFAFALGLAVTLPFL